MNKTRKELYHEYLQSKLWKEIREVAYLLHGKICKDCQCEVNLQIHHLKYPLVFGEEDILDDLIVLCKQCHNKRHGISRPTYQNVMPSSSAIPEKVLYALCSVVVSPIESKIFKFILSKTYSAHRKYAGAYLHISSKVIADTCGLKSIDVNKHIKILVRRNMVIVKQSKKLKKYKINCNVREWLAPKGI